MATDREDMPEKIKLPPPLSMTDNKTDPSRSEYHYSFTPKLKLVQPHIKLASSFMYRRTPEYVRSQPRESFQPGLVPAARIKWRTWRLRVFAKQRILQ